MHCFDCVESANEKETLGFIEGETIEHASSTGIVGSQERQPSTMLMHECNLVLSPRRGRFLPEHGVNFHVVVGLATEHRDVLLATSTRNLLAFFRFLRHGFHAWISALECFTKVDINVSGVWNKQRRFVCSSVIDMYQFIIWDAGEARVRRAFCHVPVVELFNICDSVQNATRRQQIRVLREQIRAATAYAICECQSFPKQSALAASLAPT